MTPSTKRIRVRFAPSPTGFLHIGGLRTALYNYLFAKKLQGDFILRIEDTDQSRFVPGAIEHLLQTLHEFKLTPDEGLQILPSKEIEEYGAYGPYRQSQRLALYKKHASTLLESGAAYRCFCTEERLEHLRDIQQQKKLPTKYDGHCRLLTLEQVQEYLVKKTPFVIRLRVPASRTITFSDIVRGKVSFSTSLIDDQVLMKTDGFPTYHLASVVDDYEMKISHIIRGEEWLSSVPKHLLLYEAFGWTPPQMAHLPILLNAQRAKLSKRMGSVSCEDYLEKGFLPEALLNYLLLLGWNPKTEKEIFSRKEMIEYFALEDVHIAGAIVDDKKLAWMNEKYIKQMPLEELIHYAVNKGFIDASWKEYMRGETWKIFGNLVKDRLVSLQTLRDDISCYFADPSFAPELLIQKKSTTQAVKKILDEIILILENQNDWSDAKLKKCLEDYISKNALSRGDVLWPIRIAITGRQYSPGTYELLPVFSKETVLRRLKIALDRLKIE